MSTDATPVKAIGEHLEDSGIVLDRGIRELFIPYLSALIVGTEYQGNMDVVSQNTESSGENSIIVGIAGEADAMNAYNGITGYDVDFNSCLATTHYRHDRDITIVLEINMGDNDALWMFTKYLSTCLARDIAKLTSSGKLKMARYPTHDGITVKDVGARKIWAARLTIKAKMHNMASMEAEIY